MQKLESKHTWKHFVNRVIITESTRTSIVEVTVLFCHWGSQVCFYGFTLKWDGKKINIGDEKYVSGNTFFNLCGY